ncbi:MAG: CPBP family intramembrane glutamic endopeptidase [Acidobacteriota bacterium]
MSESVERGPEGGRSGDDAAARGPEPTGELAAPSGPPPLWLRVLRHPLSRLSLATVALVGSLMVTTLLVSSFASGAARRTPVGALLGIAAAHVAYLLYLRLVEGRRATELGVRGASTELALGLLLGGGVLTVSVTVLWALGLYEVVGLRAWSNLAIPLGMAMWAGYFEELLFRGVLQRIVDEWLGSWWALVLSSAAFGFAHHSNPNADLWSSTAITLEAGLMLGAAFLLTRRLWLAIGLHAGWNFTQSGLLGAAVSGHDIEGLVEARFTGPAILTGGDFGLETSVITVSLAIILGLVLLVMAHRRGHVVSWRQRRNERRAARRAVEAPRRGEDEPQ